MSDPTGPVSAELDLERRDRRGWALARVVYLGIPAIFFVLLCWIGLASRHPGPALALAIPAAMFVINLRQMRKNRYLPMRWPVAGYVGGGITGLVVSLSTIVLDFDWLVTLFLVAMFGGALIGRALGNAGNRAVSMPPGPDLAESPYELIYRLRSPRNMVLVLNQDKLAIKALILRRSPNDVNRTGLGVGPDYPIEAITGTHEVSLSGAERLKFPVDLQTRPQSSPGPALIVQLKGIDWVLPIRHAAGLAALISRRAELRRTQVEQELLAALEADGPEESDHRTE
ncbi:hypothetical protein [Kribbella deserti]|uniref:Uncharacterized protein n=1 Tax=Kribbella deserti TaxID=1926257 RepID=A0ABV6QVS8_9ACTN